LSRWALRAGWRGLVIGLGRRGCVASWRCVADCDMVLVLAG